MSAPAQRSRTDIPAEPNAAGAPFERTLVFECLGEQLLGILHPAVENAGAPGVLIVVGGPQYRVGSHRQFTQLARALAACGHTVLRFDCRGMGDSSGVFPGFERIGPDIRAAVDALLGEAPAVPGVVIFGLCDAAAAALLYCSSDPRIRGLVLANPWVRTHQGEARAFVKHYYGQRLLQASFWRKLFSGRLEVMASVTDFARKLGRSRAGNGSRAGSGSFIERMLHGLSSFRSPVLVLLSGQDLTAQEFRDLCAASTAWGAALRQANITHRALEGADHTFSSDAARSESTQSIVEWLRGQVSAGQAEHRDAADSREPA